MENSEFKPVNLHFKLILCYILLEQMVGLYIYIYIYCHPQTDCFLVSQLFIVAKHVRRFKLGSKPVQLYVRLSIRPLGQKSVPRWLRNYKVLCNNSIHSVRLFTFYTLPETRVLNSIEELCIMQPTTENSFTRLLNLPGGAYGSKWWKRIRQYGEKLKNKVIQNEEIDVKESRRYNVSVLTNPNHHQDLEKMISSVVRSTMGVWKSDGCLNIHRWSNDI